MPEGLNLQLTPDGSDPSVDVADVDLKERGRAASGDPGAAADFRHTTLRAILLASRSIPLSSSLLMLRTPSGATRLYEARFRQVQKLAFGKCIVGLSTSSWSRVGVVWIVDEKPTRPRRPLSSPRLMTSLAMAAVPALLRMSDVKSCGKRHIVVGRFMCRTLSK